MEIASPAFEHQQMIPRKYTCEGEDISPPLFFKNIPEKTQSLSLIIEDPDAPRGVFDHWIVWNLAGTTQSLEEGADVPKQGKNGFNVSHYRGPCPPPGKPHRYFIKVYALDIALNLPEGSSKKSLLDAMEGHILGEGELIGIYQR